jgi:hypothetical protein
LDGLALHTAAPREELDADQEEVQHQFSRLFLLRSILARALSGQQTTESLNVLEGGL